MAAFNFILDNEDQIRLINFLLEDGAVLVPDLFYKKKRYQVIKNAQEQIDLERNLKTKGPTFVSWNCYDQYPYIFHSIKRDEGLRYSLTSKSGGPYIELLLCGENKKEYGYLLTTGFVAHYSCYWIDELDENIPMCQPLKEKYKEVVKFIKKGSKKLKAGRRVYWVGEKAFKGLVSGAYRTILSSLELPDKK